MRAYEPPARPPPTTPAGRGKPPRRELPRRAWWRALVALAELGFPPK